MTAKQFEKALRKLDLSQRQLAIRLGIDVTTVNRWARDRGPIPQAVALLLECWAKNGGPPGSIGAFAPNSPARATGLTLPPSTHTRRSATMVRSDGTGAEMKGAAQSWDPLTAADVAAILRVPRRRVRHLGIPCVQLGPNTLRWLREDVEEWVRRKRISLTTDRRMRQW